MAKAGIDIEIESNQKKLNSLIGNEKKTLVQTSFTKKTPHVLKTNQERNNLQK